MNFAIDIDDEKPWNVDYNGEQARMLVPTLLNPQVRPLVVRDSDGYGLSHYAGNRNVFESENRLGLQEVSHGSSHTLLVGEVNSNFQAWAKPRTSRDPALGINRSPNGFGSPTGNGAQFLMSDGSVKQLSNDTDPAVLKSLGATKQ